MELNINKIFATSDTHFFHKNILKFARNEFDTLEDMHEIMIEKWNEVVPKDGLIIHCGDFAFQPIEKQEEIKKIVKQLNGQIVLILGNHDRGLFKKKSDYFRKIGIHVYRDETKEFNYGIMSLKMNGKYFTFSHEPVEILRSNEINIHGHLHKGAIADFYALSEDRINANIELNDFKPLNLGDIMRKYIGG